MNNILESKYLNENDLLELGISSVGKNVRISANATVVGLENISLGNNIRIDSYVVILSKRGKLSVGNNVHIEPSCSIVSHYGVEIGNYCTLSHGTRLYTASANYNGEFFTNVFPEPSYQVPITGKIVLKDHVIIGGNSVVMPGVTLFDGAAIGALSFVKKSVEGWSIYGGNPLKKLGKRKTKIKEISDMIDSKEP